MNMSSAAKAPGLISLFNPLARRVLRVGPLLGPNALITVRGRKSGEPRTTPVALVQLDGRRWVIGTFGEVNWVRNLRVAGEATLTVGKREERVTAEELTQLGASEFFRDRLGPYVRRIPLGRIVLGVLGAREILADPAAAAAKRPVFELHPA
jgi:deazaflavin-dependent oxidoreductase (nitroreductase family)